MSGIELGSTACEVKFLTYCTIALSHTAGFAPNK